MSIGINYANTGLVTQNHTVINAVRAEQERYSDDKYFIDDTLARMDNGETFSHGVCSATNTNLTSKIKTLFTEVNCL